MMKAGDMTHRRSLVDLGSRRFWQEMRGRKSRDVWGTRCEAQKAFVLDSMIALKEIIAAEQSTSVLGIGRAMIAIP